ncbi:S-adenosyl-L-methionine-dependent methyltransferase [Xylaria intraflava]|nr:S-adenosyl-L-methionine-dependent methyltransferase [Xylaria intraflava]
MSSEADHVSILSLAEKILQDTKQVIQHLKASNVALPTFSATSEALPTTPDFQQLQARLRTDLEDLQLLISGPSTFYRYYLVTGYELAAFQLALDFELFSLVPAQGDISLEDLAGKAGLDQDRTNRIIRMLITQHIFQETRPGFFGHNAFSIALQKDEEMRSMVHYSFDEMLKACANSGDAIKSIPFDSDSVHCPFFSRFGTSIYDYYKQHPEHSGRFGKAMAGWRKMTYNITELRDSYPWGKLQGTVVDIGGGSGHVSMELARSFPHLKFAVQDGDASMLAIGEKQLVTEDLRNRISFTRANFFEPQPYKGATAYLIRQCAHNWADADVVTMFRSIVPGLEGSAPGTPLLINDMIMPEPGTRVPRLWERERRQADMVMLVCFGAKQRTVSEFKRLLNEADPRYVLRKVYAEEGELGLLEVYLNRQ